MENLSYLEKARKVLKEFLSEENYIFLMEAFKDKEDLIPPELKLLIKMMKLVTGGDKEKLKPLLVTFSEGTLTEEDIDSLGDLSELKNEFGEILNQTISNIKSIAETLGELEDI